MKEKNIRDKSKVGILTFHYSNNNFGAVLQTYSVYNLIKSLGCDPYIINYRPPIKGVKAHLFNLIQVTTGLRFAKFRKENIPNILRKTNSLQELKTLNEILDIFTVGSDQVWRYREDKEALKRYYLDFVDEDKPKIAVAASFGLEKWEGGDEITQEIKRLTNRFNGISVREEAGIAICKREFGADSNKILDPTMLVDPAHFHSLAEKSNLKKNKKFLAYMLLDHSLEYENHFQQLAKSEALNFKAIKGLKIKKKPDIWWFNSINDWLHYLKNSEFIVTDSFHTVVFAMIFRRKFICLANPNRGVSRLRNLLGMVGLENRFLTVLDKEKIHTAFKQGIDYNKVWEILEIEKEVSIKFLEKKIHKTS